MGVGGLCPRLVGATLGGGGRGGGARPLGGARQRRRLERLCVDVLASFRLLGKIKDTDPKTLTQVCADALTLGKHEDWRCRVAFLGNLDFIFEQLTDADPELLKETTVMEVMLLVLLQ